MRATHATGTPKVHTGTGDMTAMHTTMMTDPAAGHLGDNARSGGDR